MNKYVLVVAYEGTHYSGWQIQKKEKSVAATIQKAFYTTFGVSCTLTAASRTDAGVHAMGQIVLCKSIFLLPESRLLHAWNNALPHDITIRSLHTVQNAFHPLRNVLYKIYKYTIFKKRPLPHNAAFGWFYSYIIDEKLLQESLALFIGTHDFLHFCTYNQAISTIRTIQKITIVTNNDIIEIVVQGKSFLHHMIRRIIGAAVMVASHRKYTKKDIEQLLDSKEKIYCFQTAPARGLSLEQVVYQQED